MTTSMVFVKSSTTTSHVLVKVYADGHRIGVLAFPKKRWQQIEERGGVEIFVGTAYQEDAS